MNYRFKRKEEKFILPLALANEIQNAMRHDLHFSEYNRGGQLTDIRTTYLENDDFLIYHLKKIEVKKRYKIRLREYGRNGQFEPLVWIELKEKVDGLGYKNRFRINREYIGDFIEGKNVFSSVLLENPGIEYDFLAILYERMQSLILEKELYPRLVMQYQRLALQGKGSQGVRLTFDYNLQGGILKHSDSPLNDLEKTLGFDENKSIVELKIGSLNPEKSKEIKDKFSLDQQKFSKFIYGIESLYTSFNTNPLSLDTSYIPLSEFLSNDKEYVI